MGRFGTVGGPTVRVSVLGVSLSLSSKPVVGNDPVAPASHEGYDSDERGEQPGAAVVVMQYKCSLASGGAETLDLVVDSGDVDQLAAHHIGEVRREVLLECLAVLARGVVLALLGDVQHTTGARSGQRILQ